MLPLQKIPVMFRKILATIRTRVLIAIGTLLVVTLNARFLGATNVGTISLIILSITIVQTINNFVGGGALIYLVPRIELFNLFLLSYAWAIITSVLVVIVIQVLGLIPDGYFVHVILLSLVLSFSSINGLILLGKERIAAYNGINLLQLSLLLGFLVISLFFGKRRDVMIYLDSLYFSGIIVFFSGFFLISPHLKFQRMTGIFQVVKQIFRYGSVMNLGNIFQLFNYRLSYYFMETFLGRTSLGIYSVGAQVAEGIWIISRSISTVQNARISNADNRDYAIRLTMILIKTGTLITIVSLVTLLAIPSSFFAFLFGNEFEGIKLVMFSLAIGVVSLSISIILGSFFSGIGKPIHNTIGSGIGLVFTIVLGLLFIPRFGLIGAGVVASVSYSVATLYLVFIFLRYSRLKPSDFLLTKAELLMIRNEVRLVLYPPHPPAPSPEGEGE
jgi:O-antigen/teichoic acid export membrane protein